MGDLSNLRGKEFADIPRTARHEKTPGEGYGDYQYPYDIHRVRAVSNHIGHRVNEGRLIDH